MSTDVPANLYARSRYHTIFNLTNYTHEGVAKHTFTGRRKVLSNEVSSSYTLIDPQTHKRVVLKIPSTMEAISAWTQPLTRKPLTNAGVT